MSILDKYPPPWTVDHTGYVIAADGTELAYPVLSGEAIVYRDDVVKSLVMAAPAVLLFLDECIKGWKQYLPEGCGESAGLTLPGTMQSAINLIAKIESGEIANPKCRWPGCDRPDHPNCLAEGATGKAP